MARRGCSSQVVLVAALATLLFQVTAAEPKNEEDIGDFSRIVGGQETSSTKFPWQVYVSCRIEGFEDYASCGGSIISTTWVMSAAHCFPEEHNGDKVVIDRINIFAGMTDIPKGNSDSIHFINKDEFNEHLFIYPDYKKGGEHNNDIALIKLKNQLTLTDKVQPIDLAASGDFISGKKLTASGFGKTSTEGNSSNILLYIDGLNLISREICADIWSPHIITENMICHRTDDRATCRGDSGGPVITGRGNSSGPPYVQIGIVSFGSKSCESYNYPDVFVDVAKFTGWINHIMYSVDDCTDQWDETYCEKWKGYCEHAMAKYCKKTCNNCLSGLCTPQCVHDTCIAPNTCSCKQGWEGPQCQNVCTDKKIESSCKYYADQGFCEEGIYVTAMAYYCKKTCNKYQGVKCSDKKPESICKYFADQGFCEKGQHVGAMSYYCKKTCKKYLVCTDNYLESSCKYYADRGRCDPTDSWPANKCKKTCKKCPATCSDKKPDCKYYADQGWCEEEKHVNKMIYFCKRTCNKCQEYTEYACEDGADLNIACPAGYVIAVSSANYGRTSNDVCYVQGIHWHTKNCRSETSLQVVTDRCDAKRSCNLAASNANFGDPCHNVSKYLEVHYTCEPENNSRISATRGHLTDSVFSNTHEFNHFNNKDQYN